jgi:hypothetical protein
MTMSTKTPKLATQEARYGVNLNYVIFPLDFRDLRYGLAKNGYELPPVKDMPAPPTRLSYGGEIARIKETRIFVDSDSGEIGVIDRLLQQARASFDDLAKVILSELGVDLNSKVKFHFLTVHYRVDTGKTPLKEIARAENKEFVKKFNDIMKEDLSSFSIRLCPKNANINDENWFDIAIEPDIMDESRYHIGVVYRNSERKKIEAFAENLESNLLKLLKCIEA